MPKKIAVPRPGIHRLIARGPFPVQVVLPSAARRWAAVAFVGNRAYAVPPKDLPAPQLSKAGFSGDPLPSREAGRRRHPGPPAPDISWPYNCLPVPLQIIQCNPSNRAAGYRIAAGCERTNPVRGVATSFMDGCHIPGRA